MEQCFIDSSAFFALADQSSKSGEKIKSFLLENQLSLLTTNFILAETISLITKRIGKHEALKTGEKILSSHTIGLSYVDEASQKEAWNMFKHYKDKDFDLIDATSFVFCRKQKIKEVITLDYHFAQMGFKVIP